MDKQLFNGLNDYQSEQQRCVCNKLLCVIKGNNIEIKCNKCERIMVIKTKGIEQIEVK
ncbi:hypothetical protein [Desulfofalx alkaliphila]|uniref:hypothetical protein n=1 Tax=Desulfofalx alkaliphila TaxID=105483 RepID=UPI000A58993C|nr:hypothetical protein [Desulfofalx alkaliphila]